VHLLVIVQNNRVLKHVMLGGSVDYSFTWVVGV
jgi:hypothetical protein